METRSLFSAQKSNVVAAGFIQECNIETETTILASIALFLINQIAGIVCVSGNYLNYGMFTDEVKYFSLKFA